MLTVKELSNIDPYELKEILRKEGNSSCSKPKHSEWLDIFELMSMCQRSGLCELETWNVLRNRFEVDYKTLTDIREEKVNTILL